MKLSRSILILTIVLILKASVFSQTTFFEEIDLSPFDRGVTVEEISESGFVITGYTTADSVSNEDVLLIRTDLSGDTLWTKSFGGSGADFGWAVRQINGGGFIIAGYTDSFGAGGMDIYLIRTDAAGDTLWTKTYGSTGDEYGWDVRITKDGGFIIAAQTNGIGNGEIDAYLIKTDSYGNVEWKTFYGGDKTDRVFSVQQTPDGGYVAVGISYSFTSINAQDRDAYLLKTNSSGEIEWSKTFGGDAYDVGHSVALTNDGGYIITGYGKSFASNGTLDVYLIKTDADGEEEWSKVYGDDVDERGIKGYQTSDGGYVVVGFTANHADLYLLKTDSQGEQLWTNNYGTSGRVEFGYTVRETSDGGLIVTGHTQNFDQSNGSVLLIKTDSKGKQ